MRQNFMSVLPLPQKLHTDMSNFMPVLKKCKGDPCARSGVR